MQQGDGEAARPILEESVAAVREIGDTWSTVNYQHSLALAVLLQGDTSRATVLLMDSLTLL